MKYVIKYDDCSDLWVMPGKAYRTVGECLDDIARENEIGALVYSESQFLLVLQACGLEIEILEADGSKVSW